jgi:capsular polysaccharide biosynthesis protein
VEFSQLGSAGQVLLHEKGSPFFSFADPRVEDSRPCAVADWPIVRRREPDRIVYRLDDAGLYDDDATIYHRPTRQAVYETLDYWNRPKRRHPVFELPRIKARQHLPGVSWFIGGLGGQTFYHFLLETLPQLALLERCAPAPSRVLVQGYIEPSKSAWLQRAGLRSPLTWMNPLDHYTCETLFFTSRVADHYHPNPWTIETLQTLTHCPKQASRLPDQHIWALRRGVSVRAIPWEEEVVEKLPPHWSAVDFSQLTPEQTIDTCQNCAAFAGFHGAALANLAFVPSGAVVHEFYNEPKECWYPALSRRAGHHHFVHVGNLSASRVLEVLGGTRPTTSATS